MNQTTDDQKLFVSLAMESQQRGIRFPTEDERNELLKKLASLPGV